MATRDFDDPRYRTWAYGVKVWFSFICVLCGKKNGHMESHHIKKWAEYPKLRYLISNGVCLCKDCHEMVTGREEQYEDAFQRIVKSKIQEKKKWDTRQVKNKSQRAIRADEKFDKKKRTRIPRNPRGRF